MEGSHYVNIADCKPVLNNNYMLQYLICMWYNLLQLHSSLYNEGMLLMCKMNNVAITIE